MLRRHPRTRRGRWRRWPLPTLGLGARRALTCPQVLNADMDAYWASKNDDKAAEDGAEAKDGAENGANNAPAEEGEQA